MKRFMLSTCLPALLPALLLAACTPTAAPTDSVTGSPDLTFVSDPAVTLSGKTDTVLQLLHASDEEVGLDALDDAPRFSAVLNALRQDYDLTLTLMSGDLYIAGPFFSTTGQADIRTMDALGVQAAAFGNHEFDLGTTTLLQRYRLRGCKLLGW